MASAKHLIESELSRSIIAAFYTVYNYFGYGLAEVVYAAALEYELLRRGHTVARELAIQIRYEDRIVAWQRLDMVVDGKVIVEMKATERMPPYAERQLRNYLRATQYRVGLLLHFGPEPKVHRLVDFPKRVFPFGRSPRRADTHRHAERRQLLSHHTLLPGRQDQRHEDFTFLRCQCTAAARRKACRRDQ